MGTNFDGYPALELNEICNGVQSCYNDTVLDRLDVFMVAAQSYGIKLLIDMHSYNSLAAGDIYGAEYGKEDFYTNATAQSAFDARLEHVLNHVHTTLGKPWKELDGYIFGFEAENEAMIGNGQTFIQNNQQWQCERATTIKNVIGNNSGILVMTGGES